MCSSANGPRVVLLVDSSSFSFSLQLLSWAIPVKRLKFTTFS